MQHFPGESPISYYANTYLGFLIKNRKLSKKPSLSARATPLGTTSKDYRIDPVGEKYITNFKTLSSPATYVVQIYRKDMFIGSFQFYTVISRMHQDIAAE
jgi:hypothetical protein